jgi:hypothetical protein
MFTRNHIADKPGHRTGYNILLLGDPRIIPGFLADKVRTLGDTVTFLETVPVPCPAPHDTVDVIVAEFRLSQIAGYRVFYKPIEA